MVGIIGAGGAPGSGSGGASGGGDGQEQSSGEFCFDHRVQNWGSNSTQDINDLFRKCVRK